MRLRLLCICIALQVAGSMAAPDPLSKPAVKANLQSAAVDIEEAFFESCGSASWINFRRHCYLFVERLEYWYPAEQYCQSHGGHLVSIVDKAENILVSKLTYCQSAWTGRFAPNVDLLKSSGNYRWTDNSNSSYQAHDFSSISHIHQPLISISNLFWRNHVYHSKQHFVCKVPKPILPPTQRPAVCPQNWKHLSGFCYYMPDLNATYIEADYYCRGRGAHVASLHSNDEVRAISLLDLNTDGCPAEAWIGLVKLNPCRIDFSTGVSVCYKWSDRSGDHTTFPPWHSGSPNDDQVTNCVVLKDRALRTVRCYERFRFVCKKKA